MEPAMGARRIAAIIERSRINTTTEAAANADIKAALEANGFLVESEVVLGPKDRIDLMVGGIGIEVKVGHQRRAVLAQLKRYSEHTCVEALVLAIGAAWPIQMVQVGSKPLVVASLSRGWL